MNMPPLTDRQIRECESHDRDFSDLRARSCVRRGSLGESAQPVGHDL